jgi:hypothetical protein
LALSLYIDEDSMRTGLLDAMRTAGFDVKTAAEAGNRAQLDPFQLDYATSLGRAIYTRNVRDYAALHERYMRAGASHAGIILLTNQRLSIGVQIRALRRLASEYAQHELVNRAWYLLNYA